MTERLVVQLHGSHHRRSPHGPRLRPHWRHARRVVHRRLDRHLPPGRHGRHAGVGCRSDDLRPQGHQRGVAAAPDRWPSAGAGVSITHWRFTTASTGGTAKTAWNALSSPAALVAGGQISLANTALYEKLTPGIGGGWWRSRSSPAATDRGGRRHAGVVGNYRVHGAGRRRRLPHSRGRRHVQRGRQLHHAVRTARCRSASTEDLTWKAFGTNPNSYGVDIGDLNVAIKLRQHSNATASTGTFQTDATTPAATALGQVTGLTVTPNGSGSST